MQAEEFLGRILHEIVALDVELAREGYLPRTGRWIFGVVDALEVFHLPFGVVRHGHLDGVQDGHAALGHLVEILAHAVLHLAEVDYVVAFGDAHHFGEGAYRSRRVSLAAQGADRRHTRVVPAHDGALLHEFQQFAFRHHRVGQVQPRELVLVRRPDAERLDEPVVERTVDVEFERADRVGDVLDRVALPVGVVVHRVDAPLVARAVVAGMDDAVHDRVAEEHVGMRHVDLGAQHLLAVGELARLHAFEQVEVLLRRTVAPRRLFARLGDRAAAFADLLLRLVVDIGQPFADQLLGPFVELVEIVRRIAFERPVEAQPADVALDRVDILDVLLRGVRVVETQVALAAVFLRQPEVDADALGMADVQVAVGFRREAGLYGDAAVGGFLDDLFEEIQRLLLRCGFVGFDSHCYLVFFTKLVKNSGCGYLCG